MKHKRLEYLKETIDRALAIINEQVEDLECPVATQDVKVNTKNRNLTRKNHAYGPMNPLQPSDGYWESMAEKWEGATPEEARGMRCGNCVAFDVSKRMQKCMPISDEQVDPEDMSRIDIVNAQLLKEPRESFPDLPEGDDFFLGFGYCWMHHFKCHRQGLVTRTLRVARLMRMNSQQSGRRSQRELQGNESRKVHRTI